MKKIYLILFIFPILGLFGCVKQKNCDCMDAQKGYFVYAESPKRYVAGKRITAYFHPDYDKWVSYQIIGAVPVKYQKKDSIYVNVCLKKIEVFPKHHDVVLSFYKIECIEEIK